MLDGPGRYSNIYVSMHETLLRSQLHALCSKVTGLTRVVLTLGAFTRGRSKAGLTSDRPDFSRFSFCLHDGGLDFFFLSVFFFNSMEFKRWGQAGTEYSVRSSRQPEQCFHLQGNFLAKGNLILFKEKCKEIKFIRKWQGNMIS